ncbi:MAG: NapC/NirT family cytochrome c [Anaerolineales bacterium]|jgi:predicted CXXCH cytochrome family protein
MTRRNRRAKPNLAARLRQPRYFIPGLILLLGLVFSISGMLYAAHLEGSDAFCASCHTQPETKYFQRTQQSQSVDLASFHQTKSVHCIDCHSGRGVTGRLGAFMVGGRDMIAYLTHTDTQPAPLTVPIGDVNCLKCHSDVTQTTSFNRHFHRFLPQWQAVDRNAATCVSCHTSHTTAGSASLQFLVNAPTSQVCQDCHSSFAR